MSYKFMNHISIIYFSILVLQPCLLWGQADRETWQPPEQIMDSVGVKPEMIVGEVGAGRGHFTFHLAQRVGKKGKVYANDISQSALDVLSSRAKTENVKNITTVLGDKEDPLFPENKLDLIIMVYVLHHMENPVEMLNSIKKYMKPDTRLVIIEKDAHKDRDAFPHFMSKQQVLETVQKANYELEQIQTFLLKDTIFIYRLGD